MISWFQGLLHVQCVGVILGLVFCSPLSFAQDDAAGSEEDEVYLEEVVVTGTRIKRKDFTSPSPLTGYHFSDSILTRFGINNLFDKQPPQMADTTWSNNTDNGMYDVFGRTFYVSVSLQF